MTKPNDSINLRARRVWARAGVALAPWLLVLGLVAPGRPYYLDLLSNFPVHLAVLALLAAGLLAIARRWRAVAGAWALASCAMLTWHLQWVHAPAAPRPGAATIKVIQFNAHSEASANDETLKQFLRDQDADLVCIVETPWSYPATNPWLREKYPYRVEPDVGLEWPNLLLSKHPLKLTPIEAEVKGHMFSFVARRSVTVELPGGQRVLWSAMHPPSPRRASTWRSSINEAERDAGILRRFALKSQTPILVTGDFNSAPTGTLHQGFAHESGLTGWSLRFGGGTWPAKLSPWFSVPIDRVWTSGALRVTRLEIGPRMSSDHRPLVATIELPAGPK